VAKGRRQVEVEIIDDGSFKRFIKNGGPIMRQFVMAAIADTSRATKGKVSTAAPVGPYAPHIKDDVTVRLGKPDARTLWGKVGYLTKAPAGGTDPDATQPEVALWQEYGTKHNRKKNKFMWRSAESEVGDYRGRMIRALQAAERKLAI
jgi:hypothetical protein